MCHILILRCSQPELAQQTQVVAVVLSAPWGLLPLYSSEEIKNAPRRRQEIIRAVTAGEKASKNRSEAQHAKR